MQERETRHGLAFPFRRGDEGDLIAQQLVAPLRVPLGAPALSTKEHDRETDRSHQFDVVALVDHQRGVLGQVDGRLHRGLVGACAVGDERVPERQASCAPREVDGEVRRVPLVVLVVAGVQHVEVARLLGEDLARDGRVAVDQRGAVQRREEPLVRVHDEAVGVTDAFEQVAVREREERGAAVGAVDVEPQTVLARVAADAFDIVDDARVGGAGGRDDAHDGLGTLIGLERGGEACASEPMVVGRHE